MAHAPIYVAWASMKQRCQNPRCRSHEDYGARGVTVCDSWQKFEGFWADMGPTYKPGLTLDRINVNGNYEPSNCRWATQIEQQRNRRPRRNFRPYATALATALRDMTRLAFYPDEFSALDFERIESEAKAALSSFDLYATRSQR